MANGLKPLFQIKILLLQSINKSNQLIIFNVRVNVILLMWVGEELEDRDGEQEPGPVTRDHH
jgi:hypothetical protein